MNGCPCYFWTSGAPRSFHLPIPPSIARQHRPPAMKRTAYLPPYLATGRASFPTRNRPGVYLVRQLRDNRPPLLVYVGHSATDVYKAAYRHFQTWNDRQVALGQRPPRTAYRDRSQYLVRVIYTRTGRQAAALEAALIVKHRPRDNRDKFAAYELTETGADLVRQAAAADIAPLPHAPF